MHLNDDQIQRWLHGELDTGSREMVSTHAATCEACARRISDARDEEAEILQLLGALDHPVPRSDAASFMPTRSAWGSWGRRAAIFAAAVALAGAAYAIPGSPLRTWVKQVAERIAGAESPDDKAATNAPVTSGIAVPVQERFEIDFVAEQATGAVALSLTDGPNIVVRAIGGTAAFTADAERLTIDNRTSAADYEIEIPRAASWVEIHVGARQVVVKDGARFAEGLAPDPSGRPRLSLAPPDR
jgi:hypothetical protein